MTKLRVALGPLWNYLNPFWVSGLAVLCVLLGSAIWGTGSGFRREGYEWPLYLTLGTIFPALLLAFSLPTRFSGFAPSLAQMLKLVLAILFFVLSILFILAQYQYYALIGSAAHLLLIYALRRSELLTGPASILISVFVIVLSWTVAAKFMWWSPYDVSSPLESSPRSRASVPSFDAWFSDSTFDAWFFDWKYRILVFGVSLLLVFVNLYPKGAPEGNSRYRFGSLPKVVLDVVAILVFGLASVRSDQLFNWFSYPHWGLYVGPAEMVREGGWLLWDVPFYYGFLSTLTIAFLPVESVWQSLYIAISLLLFLSAVFLFFILRSLRAGFANFCFSFAVTLAAVFLMPGWSPELLGPQIFPSNSAFRFFWCYALLGILIWEFRTGSKDPPWHILLVGCVIWLVGTLWSFESAVYCAAIWIPAYALLVVRKVINVYTEQSSLKSSFRTALSWIAIPPLFLLAVTGMISAYYAVSLGHLPDWSAFSEYSASFASSYVRPRLELSGPGLPLFLVFCAFSTVAVYFLRSGLTQRALSLVAGTWGALWAMGSYLITQGDGVAVAALSPILCVAIGVTLYLLAHYQKTDRWALLLRTSFIPVLTVLLTTTFGNAAGFANYISPQAGYFEREIDSIPLGAGMSTTGAEERPGYEREIDSHLPVMEESLRDLLDVAQVKTDDPIVYYVEDPRVGYILSARPISDGSGVHLFSPSPTWLPTQPFLLLDPLSDERKELYVSRFVERARLGGWLIESKKEAPYTSSSWFSDPLQQTHTPTEVFENDEWRLTWFEFSDEDAAGA